MYANKLTSFADTTATTATDKSWTTVQKKYVAPSKRNSSPYGNNNNNNNNNKLTDKKELKKKTHLDINNTAAFPTLGNNTTTKSTVLSFSAAAAAAATSQIKEVKPDAADNAVKEEILPGWVNIRKNNNQIQYKYGEVVYDFKKEERENTQLSNVLFKYRIEREQYERDIDVERLGDLSEFYNLPTLMESYNSDDLLCNNEENNSDNER